MSNNTTTYTYSITRPHAVEVVTNPDGTISNVTQNIYYSPFNKVDSIKENNYKLTYTYGPDQQRRKSILTTNNLPLTTIYYAGGYEEITVGSDVYKVHYITSPAGLIAINVSHNNTDQLYYVYTDHLGSIIALTDDAGNKVYETNFDAWGRERNPSDWTYTAGSYTKPEWLIRGFTGHEHLPEFALINMNGRCYDPVLGRMLSPDNYVQNATGTQAFNRYSYAGNNPLVYTDPDGEWFGVDDAIAAGAGFVFGYLSHGITTGDWGWNAVASGGIGAATAWLGYNTFGASAGLTGWQYAGNVAVSTVSSAIMPPINIPMGNNFTLSISPGIGLGPNGLVGGFNVTGTYTNGDWSVSAGYGMSNTGYTAYGGATYYDISNDQYFSYYGNYFGGGKDNQYVHGIGFNKNDVSVRIENDFGTGHDRWRSSAVELGIGDAIVGTQVYTNAPNKELKPEKNYRSRIAGANKAGTYSDSKVYNSPFYVGYRSQYGVTRIGIDAPLVQDLTQNLLHKWIGSPYFYTPYGDYLRPYSYSGRYNPFTLY